MAADETPLLERVRRGDAAALAEFIEGHRGSLLAYVERRLGAALRGKVEPDDVVQEAAVQALRHLAQTDLTGRDPFGWLCHLAEQRIIDAHRKFVDNQKRAAGREVPLHAPAAGGRGELVDLLVASLTTPSAAFSRDARAARLQEALARLPEESRTALRLRYVDDLPTREIALRVGKTDGAVRVLLTRTLHRLQQLLDAAV